MILDDDKLDGNLETSIAASFSLMAKSEKIELNQRPPEANLLVNILQLNECM